MAFQDDGAAAIRATQTARELSPIDPFGYYYDRLASTAYLAGEQWQNALDHADRSLDANDRHTSTYRAKITALHFLDRGEDAQQAACDMMRRQPNFRLDAYRKSHPSADHKLGQRVIEALAASGIQ